MQKTIIKTCKKHGTVDFTLEGRGYYRCKKCRILAVTKNRQKRKLKLVNHFGGCCIICGYNKCLAAMHFHHKDPLTKNFEIAFGLRRFTLEKLLEETKKCVLLCNRCHTEFEEGLVEIP